MAEEGNSQDGAVAEIEKKIIEAFEVFDQGGDKTVSIRDIGSIVRSLGCFPTEAEIHELLANQTNSATDARCRAEKRKGMLCPLPPQSRSNRKV